MYSAFRYLQIMAYFGDEELIKFKKIIKYNDKK